MKVIFTVLLLVFATQGIAQEAEKSDLMKPVPVKSGKVAIRPTNTRIDFVGTHEGPEPNPRKGGFAKFMGKAQVAPSDTLQSIEFAIETASVWTEIPKLTAHLKSPDFFDVREHSKASFQSSSIVATDTPGMFDVVGQFTLLGNTKEIKIPAKVSVTPQGVSLTSEFMIDRTQFGMNYGQGKVANDVSLKVTIGQPTTAGRQR